MHYEPTPAHLGRLAPLPSRKMPASLSGADRECLYPEGFVPLAIATEYGSEPIPPAPPQRLTPSGDRIKAGLADLQAPSLARAGNQLGNRGLLRPAVSWCTRPSRRNISGCTAPWQDQRKILPIPRTQLCSPRSRRPYASVPHPVLVRAMFP